jgi:hypothetical protein
MDMLDEVSEVSVQPDGKVKTKKPISDDQTIREMQAKELEESIAEFLWAWKKYIELRPDCATDLSSAASNIWWKTIDALALANSRFKEAFILGYRHPESIAQFHKFKLKMILGKRYQVDA